MNYEILGVQTVDVGSAVSGTEERITIVRVRFWNGEIDNITQIDFKGVPTSAEIMAEIKRKGTELKTASAPIVDLPIQGQI